MGSKDKILRYIKVFLITVLFGAVYFVLPSSEFRQVWVYFLILASLFASFALPSAAVILNGAALALLLLDRGFILNLTSASLCVFLIGTVVIPFYFKRVKTLEEQDFRRRYFPALERLTQLQSDVTRLKSERKEFEREIEKINKLYVLGRELVEHMETSEVIEHLQRILLDRPGIKTITIFSWEKSRWKPLLFSNPEQKNQWLEFVEESKFFKESEPKVLVPPEWIDKDAVVFWPVKMDRKFLAAIFLTVEQDYSSRYLEEGAIFIPLIALGIVRTRLFAEVKDRSRVDGLTGLHRREYFLERLDAEVKRAERYKTKFSIIMLDIDHFKKINDTYGHVVGDEVLASLAKLFTAKARPGDLVGRYGGEEFMILLHMITPRETLALAESIRAAVAKAEFSRGSDIFKATISIGVSHFPDDGPSMEELLSAADQALYWVKANGRNGVKEYSKSLSEKPK
ncbi:MAG TPA: hypothetical protein DEE98_02355 [Elusimicrobia bacterium]|nr:MAG: hypothetical protein A2278_00005 [Elusimicrobia bacterium RIFOXYA12_FULL_49_49]OGS10130.1 MAG: hypothetical protein A2204_04860 [Elusimicrobia bacterium RIFOXYA1_FULL_47_7]OGS15821.1 MAG: hypothetical protein A2251_04140 [Elusimicrobia bacterium RIFOXYA2_FULL_47_53]OGS31153.1 MAG: hypothetical protein A2323_08860 [Elusimicrobia bacterium RIFOXYB2_FULL_46_23]HBU69205.1 hypothetical protein [Elusimicrobiota bacterium]